MVLNLKDIANVSLLINATIVSLRTVVSFCHNFIIIPEINILLKRWLAEMKIYSVLISMQTRKKLA